uniref:Uncharacterized protein n=1 Tax=mine drainage metagenome TaxID=410659 RepID=E6QV17_9ZZZZ
MQGICSGIFGGERVAALIFGGRREWWLTEISLGQWLGPVPPVREIRFFLVRSLFQRELLRISQVFRILKTFQLPPDFSCIGVSLNVYRVEGDVTSVAPRFKRMLAFIPWSLRAICRTGLLLMVRRTCRVGRVPGSFNPAM